MDPQIITVEVEIMGATFTCGPMTRRFYNQKILGRTADFLNARVTDEQQKRFWKLKRGERFPKM